MTRRTKDDGRWLAEAEPPLAENENDNDNENEMAEAEPPLAEKEGASTEPKLTEKEE